MDALRHLDFWLLQQATQWAAASDWARQLTYICAEALIFVFPLVLYLLWQRPEVRSHKHGAQKAVVLAVVSVVVALAIKSLITVAWFRARPFITHPELLHFELRSVDSQSFPSAHTMIAFAAAFSIYLSGYKKLGWVMLVIAVLIGLGRVLAGVHYPSDVLGGAVIGLLTASYLHSEASTIKRYLPDH